MKTFDVVVGKQNGHFLASVSDYPQLAQIGATAEEAVGKAKSAMEEFLTSAQVVTVTVNAPEANGSSVQQLQLIEREFAISAELNSPDADSQRGSLSSLVRAAADCRINTGSAMFKEYEAELEAEKARQCAEADELYQRDAIMRELEIAAALNDPTPAWPPGSPKAALNTIAACRIDPHDKLYQQYVAVLEAEEQQQREAFERENSAAA